MAETEKPVEAAKLVEAAKPVEAVKKAHSNTVVEHPGVRNTGFAAPGETRRVRVLVRSYVNDALHEPGAITHWPAGVEKLGHNLEE